MVNINGVEVVNAQNKIKELEEKLALQTRIEELEAQLVKKEANGVKKNHQVGKASSTRKYVLLKDKLPTMLGAPNIPQQQADIAKILLSNFKVNEEVSEAALFSAMVDGAGEYESLYTSVQDPTYLFKYYRGLNSKSGKKQAGFVERGFFRVIG